MVWFCDCCEVENREFYIVGVVDDGGGIMRDGAKWICLHYKLWTVVNEWDEGWGMNNWMWRWK